MLTSLDDLVGTGTAEHAPPAAAALDEWVRGAAAPVSPRPDEPPVVDVPMEDIDPEPIGQVRLDGLNEDQVQLYCTYLDQGKVPPPLKFYRVEGRRLLAVAAGYHRLESLRRKGFLSAPGRIYEGKLVDVLVAGGESNAEHGLALTKADRTALCVKLLLTEDFARGELSQRTIARACGLSEGWVSEQKKGLTLQGRIVPPDQRKTVNGRVISTAGIGTVPRKLFPEDDAGKPTVKGELLARVNELLKSARELGHQHGLSRAASLPLSDVVGAVDAGGEADAERLFLAYSEGLKAGRDERAARRANPPPAADDDQADETEDEDDETPARGNTQSAAESLRSLRQLVAVMVKKPPQGLRPAAWKAEVRGLLLKLAGELPRPEACRERMDRRRSDGRDTGTGQMQPACKSCGAERGEECR